MSLFLEVCRYSMVIHPQPSRECHFVHSLGKNLFKINIMLGKSQFEQAWTLMLHLEKPLGKRVSFIQTFRRNVILIHLK